MGLLKVGLKMGTRQKRNMQCRNLRATMKVNLVKVDKASQSGDESQFLIPKK